MLRLKDIDAVRNPELYLFTVANNLVEEHALVERRRNSFERIEDPAVDEQLAQLLSFDTQINTNVRNASLDTPNLPFVTVAKGVDSGKLTSVRQLSANSGHLRATLNLT
jgi:hypothetical protein